MVPLTVYPSPMERGKKIKISFSRFICGDKREVNVFAGFEALQAWFPIFIELYMKIGIAKL